MRETLADVIYGELKRRIISYEFDRGERLNIDLLARELDVSPSPVKEALKQLEVEGFVEIKPRRGTVVRRFTKQDVVDVYGARLVVEPAAAAIAIRNQAVTTPLLGTIENAMQALEAASSGPNFIRPMEVTETDGAFHRLIVEATGNAVLASIHSSLIDRAHVVRNFASHRPRAIETNAEHRRIFEALVTGNEREAEAASIAHLRAAEAFVLASMEDE